MSNPICSCGNPFCKAPTVWHGQTLHLGVSGAEDRIAMLPDLNADQLRCVSTVPGVQKAVARKAEALLRKLERQTQ